MFDFCDVNSMLFVCLGNLIDFCDKNRIIQRVNARKSMKKIWGFFILLTYEVIRHIWCWLVRGWLYFEVRILCASIMIVYIRVEYYYFLSTTVKTRGWQLIWYDYMSNSQYVRLKYICWLQVHHLHHSRYQYFTLNIIFMASHVGYRWLVSENFKK